ncbi:F-box domain-containing protein [Favolaschia claudopus]|uniref:F-box domain-containing protein n=1 Tax=Favolaschia claudopus TaxID=2862362 RepID=A0AAW0DSI3_9AGAR
MSTAKSVELLKRQHALEHTISERAPFYPVLSLPTEIISEILVHCLPHKPQRFESSSPFTNLAPFLLLHVCRKWRAIATAIPRLWQTLRLDFYAIPLRFFDAENFESGLIKSEEQGKRVLATLFDHLSPRLERLTLDTSFAFYNHLSPTFPILRQLSLGIEYDYDESDSPDGPEDPIQTFTAAPLLEEVCLCSYTLPQHFALPWDALKVLSAEGIGTTDAVETLRVSPSLIRCTLLETFRTPNNITPFSHPTLKSFDIENFDADYALFKVLALPNLETLTIRHTRSSDMYHPHIIRFVSQLAASLHELSAPTVTLSLLQPLSRLTHIELYAPSTDFVSRFVDMLSRARYPSFLPHLQAVELGNCEPSHVNQSLVHALSSRAHGEAKLRSFRQTWDPQIQEIQVNWEEGDGLALQRLRVETGMEIYVGASD